MGRYGAYTEIKSDADLPFTDVVATKPGEWPPAAMLNRRLKWLVDQVVRQGWEKKTIEETGQRGRACVPLSEPLSPPRR